MKEMVFLFIKISQRKKATDSVLINHGDNIAEYIHPKLDKYS